MNFSGLIGSYKVNRKLTEIELAHHLQQKQRLDLSPHYQLSVIKLNSTFLESVDKWFSWKGLVSAVTLIIISIILALLGALTYVSLTRPEGDGSSQSDVVVIGVLTIVALPLLFIVIWLLRKESFAYTHYPMRFNRKTRMVYVFRMNGTVLTTPWDGLFFTLGVTELRDFWEVRAHVLADDGKTVLETFPLSYWSTMTERDMKPQQVFQGVPYYAKDDYIRGHWEFIRRYMEDGPQELTKQIQFCMPIDQKRESFSNGLERVFANFAGAPILLYLLMFPFNLAVGLFRYFAMQTSKVPVWPREVEDACVIEPDDPYAIHGAPNGDRVATFPEAAARHGVKFEHPPASSIEPPSAEKPVAGTQRADAVRRKGKRTGKR